MEIKLRAEILFSVLVLLAFFSADLSRAKEGHLEQDRPFLNASFDSINKECVGNRLEASELGRQCSRKCRRDTPCENTRKQCLCDGLCGLSCLKPDLNCPDLPPLNNGRLSTKATTFNTRVVHQCDPDYFLFGSRERLCQGDEEWSGSAGVCLKEPLCMDTIKVSHARNPNDEVYHLNDRVNYSCYPGYQPKGDPWAICKLVEKNQTAWVWTGETFKCSPKSCGDPGQIENGRRHGDSFIVASSVSYNCNEGFDLIGQSRRYCQSDNQWSGQAPHCAPITCSPTDHLDNGKINYEYPLIFNSTVEYTCDYGFQLVGLQKSLCGPKGTLIGEAPKCEEIDCGALGPLENGKIIGSSSRMGDKKEFICNEGVKFLGKSRESVCLESGLWSHNLPQCLAPCVVPNVEAAVGIYLISPELIEQNRSQTTVLQRAELGSVAEHGAFLEVICEKNFEVDEEIDSESVIQAPRCNDRSWTYIPRCKPASCKAAPPTIKNGRIRLVSLDHDSRAFIQCLDGYKLRGQNVTQCDKGVWTPIKSTCEEVFCAFPGYIEHGKVLIVGLNGMYDYKPYIKRTPHNRQISYECDSGYRLGDGAPTGATCIDGKWKPVGLPACIKE